LGVVVILILAYVAVGRGGGAGVQSSDIPAEARAVIESGRHDAAPTSSSVARRSEAQPRETGQRLEGQAEGETEAPAVDEGSADPARPQAPNRGDRRPTRRTRPAAGPEQDEAPPESESKSKPSGVARDDS
jgi:hypothetical protein